MNTKELEKLGREKRHEVNKEIREWLSGVDRSWMFEKRARFLRSEIKRLETQSNELLEFFEIEGIEPLEDFLKEALEVREKLIVRYKRELSRDVNDKTAIDDFMIETAKQYPIERLLEVSSMGWAVCPFHADKNPSAYCKNNFLYCFSCNESADVIKLYMHLYSVDFVKAVRALQ